MTKYSYCKIISTLIYNGGYFFVFILMLNFENKNRIFYKFNFRINFKIKYCNLLYLTNQAYGSIV